MGRDCLSIIHFLLVNEKMRPNIWFWVTPEQIGILSTRDCYGVALDLPKGFFFSSYIAKPGDCHHWYQCIQINCKKLKDCFSRWLWCLKNQRSKYQNVIMSSFHCEHMQWGGKNTFSKVRLPVEAAVRLTTKPCRGWLEQHSPQYRRGSWCVAWICLWLLAEILSTL